MTSVGSSTEVANNCAAALSPDYEILIMAEAAGDTSEVGWTPALGCPSVDTVCLSLF